MSVTASRVLAAAVLAVLALGAQAATYIVPPDAELIQKADDVVIATGVSSRVERDAHGRIVTRFALRVEDVLKGPRSTAQELVLTESGGILGDEAKLLSGTPHYEPGVRYLVFTSANRELEPVTFGLSLGQFHLTGGLAVRRGIHGFNANLDEHVERARDEQRFVAYVRSVVAQRKSAIDYFAGEHAQATAEETIATSSFPATSYLMQSGGRGFRWRNPSTNWVRNGLPLGSASAVSAVGVAFNQWNGTGTGISYADNGADPSATGGLDREDNKNAILLGDPNNEIDESTGVAGIGGISNATSGTIDGVAYWVTTEADVVLAATAFSQACFNAVVTHEIGHTLGLRHANQPPPGTTCGTTAECTSDAIMNSSVSCSVASSLRPYDQTAATVVYGGGGACNAPSIVTQPETRNISVGQVAQLSVGTAGTSPFTYAWFAGNPGNTTQPLAGSSASLTVAPAVTTTYWVRVSNCSTQVANSVGATVFVSCAAPSILTHPAGTTLTQGTGTTLRVSATGSSLQYQWYQGATGDTRQPLGDNSSSLVVAPSSSTQYWVRITGACGIPVSSQHATVTVVPAATTNLFMLNRRFNVQVRYRNQFANPVSEGLLTGKSLQASALSETSTFWFNSPLVVELVVRISDARPFDNAFHVYLGGLSDVEFFVTVRDTLTGKSVEYHKGANSLAGKIDRTSFPAGTSLGDALDSLTASASSFRPAPNADPSTLRVLSRYDVRVRYRNQFASPAREGYLLGRSIAKVESTETAVFYFENPESVEWIVRFTDVRPFANRVDFFHGGVSDVQYTVEVTDTVTGAQRTYGVAPFSVAGGVDRQSFTP